MHGARREAVEVYLEASGVARRLDAGERVRVLEVGFGLGLNYLVTAERALDSGSALDYHAVENDLQNAATIAALDYGSSLRHPAPLDALLASLERGGRGPAAAPAVGSVGEDRVAEIACEPCTTRGSLALSLHLADAGTLRFAPRAFDAVYLDAFSPPVNPACWTPPFLGALHDALRSDGTLVSYCVRGEIRRTLQAAGFHVERRAGPPGKRHTLLATRLS